ncbi:ribulose-phosphate 3-epimerase [Mycoplasma phocoeninasale]|uniref:Ribulose-phosphate 3-epimerase n=1 Tax=Mycoplasma phocoeninasale TaxID=2726117 RepID=A0A858U310_9MOLU|nr:ribulose-phosphate 3-epimerase [Mycoplasma phocoeninasale]QJG66351.1 ribulose-phosphate 3-epimerase [Mycoplasma phocoeninasale]
MKKISPSVLDVPKENLIDYISSLVKWGVSNVHYDVMDGIFVSNQALKLEEIQKVANQCPKHTMDIHLMVADPFKYYEIYKNIGDILTFHYEAFKGDELKKLLSLAEKDGIKMGLAIKPNTDVKEIIPYISSLSLLLVMSVEPGLGGQKFIDSSLDKIRALKEYLDQKNLSNIIIQIDGGVKDINIKSCFDAGVNLAVVGSYLVKNFAQSTIEKLLSE